MDAHYKKGLHILLSIHKVNTALLQASEAWMKELEQIILANQLECLGTVCHTFENSGGFTAVHCLTESHISIHTWPEFGICTCDVFLSNFTRDNSDTVRAIADRIQAYFEATEVERNEIFR